MNMSTRTGSLSIDSENMFPMIKKWLQSDHDIFIRELISNGCDAITKLKKLDINTNRDWRLLRVVLAIINKLKVCVYIYAYKKVKDRFKKL